MSDNPLLQPRKLDGSLPDATHGRGWADDGRPTRLTRRAIRWQRLFEARLRGLEARADENRDADSVPLTVPEQLDLEMQKGPADLEQEAGIFGPAAVRSRQDRLKQLLRQSGLGAEGG